MKKLLEIKDAKFGKGLCSKKNIPDGTILCTIPFDEELDLAGTVTLKEKESLALQVDYDRYILCVPPFLFSNHSCNPNCGVNPNFEVFALKDIRKGEELFWDY